MLSELLCLEWFFNFFFSENLFERKSVRTEPQEIFKKKRDIQKILPLRAGSRWAGYGRTLERLDSGEREDTALYILGQNQNFSAFFQAMSANLVKILEDRTLVWQELPIHPISTFLGQKYYVKIYNHTPLSSWKAQDIK